MRWDFSKSALVFGLVLFSGGIHTQARASSARFELRDVTNSVLEDFERRQILGEKMDQLTSSELIELMNGYRIGNSTNAVSIAEAPYIDFLINMNMDSIYDGAYQKAYKDIVDTMPIDLLFDGAMAKIADGTAFSNPTLGPIAKQIGVCLAKKVVAGKSDSCKLDLDEKNLKDPGIVSEAIAKFTCWASIPSPCSVRKTIFQSAKAQLVKYKKDPAIQKMVEDAFPASFPDGLNSTISKIRASSAHFLGTKTGSVGNPLWSKDAPLVEEDPAADYVMTIHDYANSLKADIHLANALAQSQDPKVSQYAGPLVYAAANRLIVIMGGTKASFNGTQYQYSPTKKPNPDYVKLIAAQPGAEPSIPPSFPEFETDSFGGLGYILVKGMQSVWDLANYDPSDPVKYPFQIFPNQFILDDQLKVGILPNLAPVETLSDIADIVDASVDFYTLTKAGRPLSQYFGSASDMGKILDDSNPMIFPQIGRQLAVGVMGMALENLIQKGTGHVEVHDTTDAKGGGSIVIIMHDQLSLVGRTDGNVPTSSIARLISSALNIKMNLIDNVDIPENIPKSMLAQASKFKDALFLSNCEILAGAQSSRDGGFSETIETAQQSSGRTLKTQIDSLLEMTDYYNYGQISLVHLNIEAAWQFLNRYFVPGSPAPRALEDAGSPEADEATQWQMLALWQATEVAIHSAGNQRDKMKIDENLWNSRFIELRKYLNHRHNQD